jgi:hypothetical protein
MRATRARAVAKVPGERRSMRPRFALASEVRRGASPHSKSLPPRCGNIYAFDTEMDLGDCSEICETLRTQNDEHLTATRLFLQM